jgi:hypothetical protein
VPRVTTFRLEGLELWFYSSDHLPPHFHAEKAGEWEVRVMFMREPDEMIEVVVSFKANKPSKGDLKDLKAKAEEHRAALLVEWEAKVLVSDPGPER